MSKYTFTFKKGDIYVDFSTTDRDVVERQFQIWVNEADEYAKQHPPKNSTLKPKAPQPKAEPKNEQKSEPKEVFDKATSLLKTINNIQNGNSEVEKETPKQNSNFDEILEKTVETPSFESQRLKDKVFINLINSKNTTDKFHYLMITAYYLSEFEKLERFSIKQINAKLMQNLSEVIDHAMLQDAINQNFIELVPDLTGTSEVGEYRLTPEGEYFFANKI